MIIFISAFTNISSGTNSRIGAIVSQLNKPYQVITTDFNHGKKEYYRPEEMSHPCQVNLHVPGYTKNLSIKRIWSHLVFAKRVKNYLDKLNEKPEAMYCAMPTSSVAFICAKYCRKYNVKFVIDIIDLWPDSLLPLVKGKAIIKSLLYPWSYLTRYVYSKANFIMGESVRYADEAKKYNKIAQTFPIYLGVDVEDVNRVKAHRSICLEKPEGELWIGYAGSLGVSYDFETLLDAVKTIKGRYKYKLWFIGDGIRRNEIELYIRKNNLNAEITGFLSHDQLLEHLSYCDIAVNIFRADTKVVYSYKFNDYVAMDCFVLNSLEGETAEMVEEYKVGKNFDFYDHPLTEVLTETISNWSEYSEWKCNTQRLIAEKLDKKKIYAVSRDIFFN